MDVATAHILLLPLRLRLRLRLRRVVRQEGNAEPSLLLTISTSISSTTGCTSTTRRLRALALRRALSTTTVTPDRVLRRQVQDAADRPDGDYIVPRRLHAGVELFDIVSFNVGGLYLRVSVCVRGGGGTYRTYAPIHPSKVTTSFYRLPSYRIGQRVERQVPFVVLQVHAVLARRQIHAEEGPLVAVC